MKLFYLIAAYHMVFLLAQSKLDSLNHLMQEYEDKITINTVELDSLQKTLSNLQAKYAEERFLLMEKSLVKRINRAAFAGMWIDEPLKGKRKDIDVLFFIVSLFIDDGKCILLGILLPRCFLSWFIIMMMVVMMMFFHLIFLLPDHLY